MTTQMIITLAIVVLMVVMIMSDKFAFGAPPLVALCLLVVTGCCSIEDAFSGFVDKNVIMIASFMVVTAGLQKTQLIVTLKKALLGMAGKGGFKNYVLLLLMIMVGAMFISGTAYYVLILTLVSTIPYNEALPNSKILMPAGYMSGYPLIPLKVATMTGIAASLLTSNGMADASIDIPRYMILTFARGMFALAWALIGFRVLPDHDVNEGSEAAEMKEEDDSANLLPKSKQMCVYIAFAVTLVAMIFLSKLGDRGYLVPGLAASFMFVTGCLNFKEVRDNIGSPMVLMMAGVIGVAAALSNSGFTGMVGEMLAANLTNASPIIIVGVFALMTSISATFTGASFGSLFIFAPIGIATCMSLGYNPTAVTVACVAAAWINWFMPIDGLPALIMGMGKYNLIQFWKYTIPHWLIQMLVTIVGAMILFPV